MKLIVKCFEALMNCGTYGLFKTYMYICYLQDYIKIVTINGEDDG